MTEPDNKTKQIEEDPMMSLTASGSKPPVYDMIGRRLREFYDDVAQQPVPCPRKARTASSTAMVTGWK